MGSNMNGAYLAPKTVFVRGLRRWMSGSVPKILSRVSCCIRSTMASISRQPSIASLIASYCSFDRATDTVLPFTFRDEAMGQSHISDI